ncbi:MAG: DUF1841 family protein [Pseudonocardiaceae bacterium]|nr:DUF1841 family protein [Pseudonocardiaceae bacterium]
MSPVSRGRKKKKGAASVRPVRSERNEACGEVLRGFLALVEEPDPLQAEMFASDVLGDEWVDEDGDAPSGLELINYASGKTTPAALALLRAMHVIGVSEQHREVAGRAAEELAEQGVAEPAWGNSIGKVAVRECWMLADVYGEDASLLCVFERDGVAHGLVALLDFTHGEPGATDLFPITEPEQTLAEMREKEVESDGVLRVTGVPPSRARRLLEDAIQDTDSLSESDAESVDEDFAEFRALALARCRALPEPDPQAGPAPEASDEQRAAATEEFLRESGLDATEEIRRCARLIVDYGYDYDPAAPQRVSPQKLTIFFAEQLGSDSVDPEVAEVLPTVTSAWTRWAAARNELPEAAAADVIQLADEMGTESGTEEYDDEDILALFDHDDHDDHDEEFEEDPSLVDYYLGDAADAPDVATLGDILDRRSFAIPENHITIDDEYLELDPRDPDDRRTLVVGEHPEYHDALDDPEFAGDVEGVNPRLFLAIKEIVINQLWDNDPPEAWEAAKRLRHSGEDRDEILRAIGELTTRYVYVALTENGELDEDAYRAALNDL